MIKKALILGVTGQDGSYLAELLLDKGYEVHGLVRRSSSEPRNLWRIAHLLDYQPGTDYGGHGPTERFTLHHGDLQDPQSIYRILEKVCPDEIYNEADQDHVGWSYDTAGYSADVTYGAVVRTLEQVRQLRKRDQLLKEVRFFQPLSATMFGTAPPPQDEETPFAPASPYAVSKTATYYACQFYRREYGLFIATAIFYNHDSERRGGDYLLQKIARGAVAIARGEVKKIRLGDLSARVDIGCACEYMTAAWNILQQPKPDDFVIGTGRGITIQALVAEALAIVGIQEISFHGQQAVLYATRYIETDPHFHRPGPSPVLVADSSKARSAFGWEPQEDACTMVRRLTKYYLSQDKERRR